MKFIYWHEWDAQQHLWLMWWSTKCPNLWLTESESRDAVHIPFIEILGGARMRSDGAGTDPIAGWEPNGCPGGRHLQCAKWKVEGPNISNQAHAGLMTGEKRRALMNHDTYLQHEFMNLIESCKDNHLTQIRLNFHLRKSWLIELFTELLGFIAFPSIKWKVYKHPPVRV